MILILKIMMTVTEEKWRKCKVLGKWGCNRSTDGALTTHPQPLHTKVGWTHLKKDKESIIVNQNVIIDNQEKRQAGVQRKNEENERTKKSNNQGRLNLSS